MNYYDVVIYDIEKQLVESFAGVRMPLKKGAFHTAEKRKKTAELNLNDDYGAAIVPHAT